MPKKKVTLSVDSAIYKDFQKYCEDHAIMLSKRIELVMGDIMDKDSSWKKSKVKHGNGGKKDE